MAGLGRESPDFKKLRNYNDPALAGPTACGDLSIAVQEVVEKRFSYDPSKITIGKVNQLLDELANIRRMDTLSSGNGDHYWQASESRSSLQYKGTGPLIKKQKIRTKWVHKLIAMKLSVCYNDIYLIYVLCYIPTKSKLSYNKFTLILILLHLPSIKSSNATINFPILSSHWNINGW